MTDYECLKCHSRAILKPQTDVRLGLGDYIEYVPDRCSNRECPNSAYSTQVSGWAGPRIS